MRSWDLALIDSGDQLLGDLIDKVAFGICVDDAGGWFLVVDNDGHGHSATPDPVLGHTVHERPGDWVRDHLLDGLGGGRIGHIVVPHRMGTTKEFGMICERLGTVSIPFAYVGIGRVLRRLFHGPCCSLLSGGAS